MALICTWLTETYRYFYNAPALASKVPSANVGFVMYQHQPISAIIGEYQIGCTRGLLEYVSKFINLNKCHRCHNIFDIKYDTKYKKVRSMLTNSKRLRGNNAVTRYHIISHNIASYTISCYFISFIISFITSFTTLYNHNIWSYNTRI